jgi:type IV pilus assembly protein PilM
MTRTVVGLDIGTAGVRAGEFAIGRGAPSLRRFASAKLPEGVVRSGRIADPPAVTEAVRALWAKGKFSSKAVVLGVANDSVLVRQMDLEWMPPADFRKALRYQVADALPVPVDEANLDYYMLDELDVPQDGKNAPRRVARVMLVAAGREMVDSYVNAVQAAGLRVVQADLMPFALVRAAAPMADTGAVEAIVDIGAETVTVVVHRGGRPRFVRMISGAGSENITRALQTRYDWAWEDAERTKIVLGLDGETPPSSDGHPATYADHPARPVIVEQVDALVAEIRTTLDFFLGSTGDPERSLSRVLLAGNGARLTGLPDHLGMQLGVPVELLSPVAAIRRRRRRKLDPEALAQLTVPVGLSLGVVAS